MNLQIPKLLRNPRQNKPTALEKKLQSIQESQPRLQDSQLHESSKHIPEKQHPPMMTKRMKSMPQLFKPAIQLKEKYDDKP